MKNLARGWSDRVWCMVRHRAMMFVLLAVLTGCGDCVTVNDFIDVTDASFDMADDAGTNDTSQPDASGRPDADPDKDFGLFDFGFDDTDIQPQPFELLGIVPSSGPVGGGTQVRVDGTGLQDGSLVFFGSQPVNSTLSQGRLVVRTPAATGPGPVSVKVLAPDGQSRVIVDGFRYVTGLVISEVTPNRVPTTGGVEVEITGEGFEPDSAVSFSGDSAVRVTYLSQEKLRALVPPRARGFADVRVTTRFATALMPRAVEYYTPLSVTEVAPASGPVAGGQTVTVRGTGFDSTLRVFFDGIEANVTAVNVAQQAAQVVVPAHPQGSWMSRSPRKATLPRWRALTFMPPTPPPSSRPSSPDLVHSEAATRSSCWVRA
ncbi:MAG: IPT/TIG domain-containing protein [bacterium]